jgi:hypothetical protein
MFGPGRGRALSLIHIPETGPSHGNSSDTTAPASGGQLALSSSEPDLRRSLDDDIEHGISLLVAGSPIDDSLAADDTLLDYDSDDGNTQQQIAVSSDPPPAAMDIESSSMVDSVAGPSTSSNFTVLDAIFHQFRASRLSGFRDNLVSISSDDTFGKKIVSPTVPIGSFEDHGGLKDTFHGSRLLQGNETVNQSISLSFDPANLVCLCCKGEHNVIGATPVTVCFSDQNFVASLPSNNENCVGVVRVENSSLAELLETAK